MKKILFSLVLLFVGQVIYAQDLNKLMDDLAKVEGAQRQVMDRDMLSTSIPESQKDKMPDFMSKVDSITAVILSSCSEDVIAEFSAGVNAAETSDAYEPLVSVKKEDNIVSILQAKSEDETKDIYIYVVGGGGATVFVKMSGKFTVEDLANIVKEQQKNDN